MVSRVFHLVYREVKGLHQAAYVLGLFAFGSQLLAIVRDRLLASTFGAGTELDLYYTAFRIPDLLFVLFASVLSVYVLLPFVNQQTDTSGKRALLSQVFVLFLGVYTVVAAILAVLAPWYVPVVFPGFAERSAELAILLQILLLQPLFLGLSSICGVITQMHHRFVLYAISPLLYNVGIIVGIVLLYPLFGLPGLAGGVVLGAIGHLLIQVPYVLRSDLSLQVVRRCNWPLLRRVVRTAIPRALTLSLNQLVLLVFISIATTFTVGSVSVFQFAYNIQSVPLAIIGMSYSVAAFPTLSALFAKQERARFNLQIVTAMRHIIFWSLPLIGLFVVLRAHVVRVLLGSGAFDWSDTRLTAAVLALFVVSLTAQALLLLLVRALYAGGRTTVPLLLTIFSASVSVALAYGGLWLWQTVPGIEQLTQAVFRLETLVGVEVLILAAAFTLGQLLQLVLLLLATRRLFNTSLAPLTGLTVRAIAAMLGGALAAYGALQFIVEGVNQDTFIGIFLQGGVAGIIGLIAVWLVYHVCRTPELSEIAGSFSRKILKTDVVAEQD